MTLFSLKGEALSIARILVIILPAFLLFGYNQPNFGGVLGYPSFVKHFPEIDTVTTSGSIKVRNAKIQGTVVGTYTLGCLVGSLGVIQLGNRFGRRKSLIAAAAVAAIGLTIQASSFNLGQLIVGRIISGIGNGAVNSITPVWQSECTNPKSRGKNVVILGSFIATGIALAGWVNVGLSYHNTSEIAWRLPLALPLVFAAMLIVFTMFFPESPRWLVSEGRMNEAYQSIIETKGMDHTDIDAVNAELAAISEMTRVTTQGERGFKDIFSRNPQRLFYRCCLAVSINIFAQMTGANVVSYYGTTIFKESLHLAPKKAAILNGSVLTWKIVAAISAFLTVDRLGRTPLFIVGGTGMGISMAGLTGTVWAIQNQYTFGASVAATFFLFLFMGFFPLGFLGANFLYSAEIAPQDLRLHFAAIGTAAYWLFNFLIAEITPIAFVTLQWKYYIVYAVIGISIAPLVILFFPETKGMLLEDMDRLFSEPTHFWQVPTYVKQMKEERALLRESNEAIKETGVEELKLGQHRDINS